VPVCFACDASDLYTALDRKPKRFPPERLARVRNIRMNPNVALLVDEYLEDWSRLWYVLVRGRAAVMPAAPDQGRRGALDLLRVKYPQYAGGLLADDALVIRIHPEGITAWGKLS
jgi:PPOX class probable F420-dependent enzyme